MPAREEISITRIKANLCLCKIQLPCPRNQNIMSKRSHSCLALPCASCVTLCELLNLFVPHSFLVYGGDNNGIFLIGLLRLSNGVQSRLRLQPESQ